jgi:hypothetical protein
VLRRKPRFCDQVQKTKIINTKKWGGGASERDKGKEESTHQRDVALLGAHRSDWKSFDRSLLPCARRVA